MELDLGVPCPIIMALSKVSLFLLWPRKKESWESNDNRKLKMNEQIDILFENEMPETETHVMS